MSQEQGLLEGLRLTPKLDGSPSVEGQAHTVDGQYVGVIVIACKLQDRAEARRRLLRLLDQMLPETS